MGDIEDRLREMAEENNPVNEPIVTVVVTVQEDLDFQDTRFPGVRREVMGADPIVQNVNLDHTVNSIGAETVSALGWSDIQNVRSTLRNAVRDAGLAVEGTAVQAEIRQRSF